MKTLTKTLAAAAIAAFTFGFAPSAQAEDIIKVEIPGWETKYYPNFAEAWEVATNGTAQAPARLTLESNNVEMGQRQSVPAGAVITIDLYGNALICANGGGIVNNGTLTIADSEFGTGTYHHYFTKVESPVMHWVLSQEETEYAVDGGVLTGVNASGDSGGAIVNNGTLILEGGSIAGNTVSDTTKYTYGGAICNNGSFTMQNGVICYNAGYQGAAIANMSGGSVVMTNGFIRSNITRNTGNGSAGLYNAAGATANLTGGSIMDNTGIGVWQESAASDSLVLGGTIVIESGVSGVPGLYLNSEDALALISTTVPLASGAHIGVTTRNNPTSDEPVKFTSNGATGDVPYFYSDAGYTVEKLDGQDGLWLTYQAGGGYITFTCDSEFTLTAAKTWNGTLRYSTNATEWETWTGKTISSGASEEDYQVLYVGGEVGITNITGAGASPWVIESNGQLVSCEGNIETLRGASGNAPSPTQMAEHCYENMFSNCTVLASTPKLPATSIAMYCYYGMFRGCTSLTRVPALPSLGGAEYAYESMFEDCSGIKLYYPGKGVESWSVGVSQSKDPDMWGKDMFKGTGGTLQGAPKTGRTYYYEWAPGYEITTVTAGEGTGTLETDPSGTVASGEIIRVTATPSEGSQIESLEAYYTDDPTQAVTIKSNQFTMPETNVTVKATFQKGGSGYAITVVKNPEEGGTVTGMPASAEQGTSVEFTVTANTAAGYSIGEVTAVGASGPIEVKGSKGKYSFTMPGEDVTVTATFMQSPTPTEKHKINIDPGVTGGTVLTEPAGEAAEGDGVKLIATPASGYTLVSKGYSDSSGYQEVTGDSFTMPGEDVTVTATFTPVTPSEYTITIDGGITGGTVTSVAKAAAGVRVVLMVTPDSKKQLGSLIVTSPLSVDPISLENNTFLMPAADVTVTAEFADPKTDPATITGYVSEGGTVTPSVETAAKGTTVTLVIAPAKGYALTSLTFVDIDGEHYAPTKTGENAYVLAMPSKAVSAAATFAHAITVVKSPTEGGNVDKMPAGAEAGTTVNFTVTANDGYSIGEVTAKSGGEVVEVTHGSKGSYSFTMPDGAVDVTVTFTSGPTPTGYGITYTRSPEAGGTVSGPSSAEQGTSVDFTVSANTGYEIGEVTAQSGGESIEVTGGAGKYAFTMPGGDVKVTVTFTGGPTGHKITVAETKGGTVKAPETASADDLVTLTVTPGSGMMLTSLYVEDGKKVSVPVKNNTFEMPDADVYVSSEFGETKGMFKIIGCEVAGGAVLPSPEAASFGTTVTLTVKPESGYQLKSMTVMGDSKKEYTPTKTGDTTYVLAMPDEGITVTATFSGGSTPHKIIINKPTGDGTITAPSEAVAGKLVTLTVTPGSGMMLTSLYVEDGKKVSVPVENNTFEMPDADVYVSSEFGETKGMFKIIGYEGKEGSVLPSPEAASFGTTVTLTVKPVSGYQLESMTVMGDSKKEYTPTKTGDTTYVLAMPDEGITVTATFKGGSTGYAITYYSNPSAGGTVSGPAKAAEKATVNFTVSANTGYVIDTVTAQTKAGAGVPVSGSAGAYSFEMPGEAVDVTATFAEAPPPEFGDYLTFSSDGSFTLATANATKGWDGTLQYSTDAESWTEWDGTIALTAKESKSSGYVLYVRGDNYNTKIVGNSEGKWVLTPAGENKIACLGNIEALRGATGDAPSPTPMGNTCYSHMFRGCQVLTTAPALPATTLANNCYESMFRDCTALTNAPALPATTLTQECYLNMFYGCTSLKTAPELPAMTLGDNCYSGMFQGCTALTNAPALPATTLPGECYIGMFVDCTSLESPAMMDHVTTIGNDSCSGMYYGCANLVVNTKSSEGYAKPWVVNATSVGSYWNEGMFSETAGSFKGDPEIGMTYYIKGEAPKFGDYLTFSSSELFSLRTADYAKGWNGTLQYYSASEQEWQTWEGGSIDSTYDESVGYVLYVRGDTANTKITRGYDNRWMLNGNAGIACTGNIEALRGATGKDPSPTPMGEECYTYLFGGCTLLTTAPELPATTLAVSCYGGMFAGCTSLKTAPALPATALAASCYSGMFRNCTSLTAAPELPATTLMATCYSRMFFRCEALTEAPELPATELPGACYLSMFDGCTSLESPAMMDHVTTIGKEACLSMYQGCTNLVVNTESSEGYAKPWVVNATFTGSNWNKDMFVDTAGTFTGDPVIGMTYYIKGEGPTPPPLVQVKPYAESGTTAWGVYTNGVEVVVDPETGYWVISNATVDVEFKALAEYGCFFKTDAGYSSFATNTVTASANPTKVEGPAPKKGTQVGESAYAFVDGGVCTIVGTGAMTDTTLSKNPLSKYRTTLTDVVVQDGITHIGGQSFHMFFGITNVTAAASVTSVGDGAFFRCASMDTIAFGADQKSVTLAEKSISYYLAITPGGTPYTVPAVTFNGKPPAMLGTETLENPKWELVEPDQEVKYHFFKLAPMK